MFRVVKLLALSVLALILNSCAPDGPSTIKLAQDLKSRMQLNLRDTSQLLNYSNDDFFLVYGVKVISSENIGNEVNPKIIGRFTASVRLTEDIYRGYIITPEDQFLTSPSIYTVELSETDGSVHKFSGMYEATIIKLDGNGNKKWRTYFTQINFEKDILGVPIEAYGPVWNGKSTEKLAENYHVFKGSPEEADAIAHFQQLEKAAAVE